MSDFTSPQSDFMVRPPDAALRASWYVWAALGAVAAASIALVLLSVALRGHADARRDVMDQLTALKVEAAGQNMLVWRAMTQLMAKEALSFVRTNGQEKLRRNDIIDRFARLRELESAGAFWNAQLGFEPAAQLLDELGASTDRFIGGVQSTFAQMNLSRDRIRERLEYWDMNYGAFVNALEAAHQRNGTIAATSAAVANRVTMAAALITLIAALLFVVRLAQLRARRALELQAERMRTVVASESRFRALVQNSADLILVLEPDGRVRYATPSAGILKDRLAAQPFAGQMRSEVTVAGADGRPRIYELRATDLSAHADIRGIVLNGRDVTEAKALEEQLRHQALHDPLTGLPNRRSFSARFDAMTEHERQAHCLLFVDLDGFKLVNDSYGHTVGDQLLIHAAARIRTCLSEGDLLVRQGGDEFLVLCTQRAVAERIQDVLAPPFEIGRGIGFNWGPGSAGAAPAGKRCEEIFVSASIGVVTNLAGIDAEQAAQRADIAMYKAKEAGKACAVVFCDEMLDGAPERLALESDFRRALERDEFTVVYQPKVGLRSGVTESLEALVRWIHPTRGFVGPDLFIPFAEESGLINELGRQILNKACRDAVRWQPHGVVVAVNVSPIQFRNPDLADEVRAALERSGLDPKFLELEITESAVLGDVQNTIRVMQQLKKLGIRLAIDDFGTGYSNLAHLKHFDVDVLKIDQAFVRGGHPGSKEHLSDGAIVEAVIGMAKAFGMHVVAEGVESSNHAAELKALGADLGQGYFFSKPVDGAGIDAFLQAEMADGRRDSLVDSRSVRL